MKQDDNQSDVNIRISYSEQGIRIDFPVPKKWEALEAHEYQDCICALRNLQKQHPHHKTIFSQSEQAYIELIPPTSKVSTPVFHTGGIQDPLYPSIRTLLKSASHVDIITAFIQDSGLRILQPLFFDALQRGAYIRILGGDYLHITQGKALQRLLDWKALCQAQGWHGTLDIFIHESKGQSFHPKCWHFQSSKEARAYVGSSNLSFTALCRGVEWNLAVSQADQPLVYERLKHSIDHLCANALSLTQKWVDRYIEEAEQHPNAPLPPGELEDEDLHITPMPIQLQALEALQKSRNDGRKRALVVMATGLGKTYVSIFDTQNVQAKKILFLAHRKELLFQAASSFRRLYPKASFGWFVGTQNDTHAQITFASVQKLTRSKDSFSSRHFDYIIVDEVHHATAKSYQNILNYFQPDFLLGLTATPDRSDQSDVRALFDDHCAFQAGLNLGIEQGLLTPFHYIGRVDPVDYNRIPWSKDRFDTDTLNEQLCSESRMKLLLNLWNEHPAKRTLVFCASIAHADAVGAFLIQNGVTTAVLHSQSHSDPREESIEALQKAEIDCICTVDLFNEGIDIPALERIIMLRPTSSGIIFLQQLGRGLRLHPQKERLTVIDLVGNHQVFLRRLHALSSISQRGGIRTLLQRKSALLPQGCSMDIDVDVIDLLSSLIGQHNNPSYQLFLDYHTIFGHRPQLSAFLRLGGNPKQLYRNTWFSFLQKEKQLNHSETILIQKHAQWFSMLEHTALTKSYKMVSLAVLIGAQAIHSGMELERFLFSARDYLLRSPLLRYDLPSSIQNIEQWKRYFLRWVASSWNQGKKWLVIEKGNIRIPISVHQALTNVFADMSMEIIRYRLQQYRTRIQAQPLCFDIDCNHDKTDLYFSLPSPKELLPIGKKVVRDHNNRMWEIAWKHPKTRSITPIQNQKQTSLKSYFSAKKYRVFFLSDGWHMEPIGEEVPSFIEKSEVPFIGTWPTQNGTVWLPSRIPESPLHFAIRAPHDLAGLSPIKKGDWLLMRWRNSAPQTAKLVQRGNRVALLPATQETDENIIAALDAHFSPHELAPKPGTSFHKRDTALTFGLSEIPKKGFSHIDGQLFLCINPKTTFKTHHVIQEKFLAQPFEQAHVIFMGKEHSQYLGMANTINDEWTIPPLFWDTYKQLGLSHEYPAPTITTAVQSHYDKLPDSGWLVHHGLQAKITKKTKQYLTLSIQKQSYRCSITDIAWALSASTTTLLDLLHHRYVMGYKPKAEERRSILASWLATFGTHAKNKKRKTFCIDAIRAHFPKQNALQCILDNPILLRFPKKKIAILLHSQVTLAHKERWEDKQKSQFPKNWRIHFLPSTMLHNTKSTIQTIQQLLEK